MNKGLRSQDKRWIPWLHSHFLPYELVSYLSTWEKEPRCLVISSCLVNQTGGLENEVKNPTKQTQNATKWSKNWYSSSLAGWVGAYALSHRDHLQM